MAFEDNGALAIILKFACYLVLVFAKRVREDPNIMVNIISDQVIFAEDYILHFSGGKFHHHRPGSRAHEHFNVTFIWRKKLEIPSVEECS